MKVFAISDPHGNLPDPSGLPENAIIFCAGDLCADFIGTKESVAVLQKEWLDTEFRSFLAKLPPGADFITTAGNHDFALQAGVHRALSLPKNHQILLDRSSWVEGVGLVQGTPWSFSPSGWAYTLSDQAMLRDLLHYTLPVRPLDVWLIHQPPLGPAGQGKGIQWGSEEIHRVALRQKVRVLICGHIHEGTGIYEPTRERPYLLINAAITNTANERVRDWMEIEIGEPYGE